MRRGRERARAGKGALETLGDELEQPLPAVEAAQLIEAEVEQRRVIGQVVREAGGGRRA